MDVVTSPTVHFKQLGVYNLLKMKMLFDLVINYGQKHVILLYKEILHLLCYLVLL